MISAINSSDNKRHITLASIGGIAWGAKEAYNTRINLSAQKNSFKKILKRERKAGIMGNSKCEKGNQRSL